MLAPRGARAGRVLRVVLPSRQLILLAKLPSGVPAGSTFTFALRRELLADDPPITHLLKQRGKWQAAVRRASYLRPGRYRSSRLHMVRAKLARLERELPMVAAVSLQAVWRGTARRRAIREICGVVMASDVLACGFDAADTTEQSMKLVIKVLLARARHVRLTQLHSQIHRPPAAQAMIATAEHSAPGEHAKATEADGSTCSLRYWTKKMVALASSADADDTVLIVMDRDNGRRRTTFTATRPLLLEGLPGLVDTFGSGVVNGGNTVRRRVKLDPADDAELFELLLRYVHGETVQLHTGNAVELIVIARRYGARGKQFERMVEVFERLVSSKECSVCELLGRAKLLEEAMHEKGSRVTAQRLQAQCMRHIMRNIHAVARQDSAGHLPFDNLLTILRCDKLHVRDEGDLLRISIRWIEYDIQNRARHIQQIASVIRWGAVPRQLLQHFTRKALSETGRATAEAEMAVAAAAAAAAAVVAVQKGEAAQQEQQRLGAIRSSKLLDLEEGGGCTTDEDTTWRIYYWVCGLPESLLQRDTELVDLLSQLGTLTSISLTSVQRAEKTGDDSALSKHVVQQAIGQMLADVPMFANLSQEQLIELCGGANAAPLAKSKGEYICKQGDVGDHFFLLTEGTAIATINVPGMDAVTVKHYAAGDWFGELALTRADSKRAANIVVTSLTARCVAISRQRFESLQDESGRVRSSGESVFMLRVSFAGPGPGEGGKSLTSREGTNVSLVLVQADRDDRQLGREAGVEALRQLAIDAQRQHASPTPHDSAAPSSPDACELSSTTVSIEDPKFIPSPDGWVGARPGYFFSTAESGLGYYIDSSSAYWATISSRIDKEAFLRHNVALLKPLSQLELSMVASATEERSYAAGEHIVVEGQHGQEMLIMLSGEASVTKDGVNGGKALATYKSGDSFGERCCFGEPRGATITATSTCHCLALSQHAMESFLLSNIYVLESLHQTMKKEAAAEAAAQLALAAERKSLESGAVLQLLDVAYREGLAGDRCEPYGITARPRDYIPLCGLAEQQAVLELHTQQPQPSAAGQSWYLIAGPWFHAWSQFCEFWQHHPTPGPIDNTQLADSLALSVPESPAGVASSTSCSERAPRRLKEDVDFVLVSEPVWLALFTHYGGGPALRRESVAVVEPVSMLCDADSLRTATTVLKFEVEMYPLRIRCALLAELRTYDAEHQLDSDLNLESSLSSSSPPGIVDVQISRHATIGQLKTTGLQALGLSSQMEHLDCTACAWSVSLGFTATFCGDDITLRAARLFDGAVVALDGVDLVRLVSEAVPPPRRGVPSQRIVESLPPSSPLPAEPSRIGLSTDLDKDIVKSRWVAASEQAFDAIVGDLFDPKTRKPRVMTQVGGAKAKAPGTIARAIDDLDRHCVDQSRAQEAAAKRHDFAMALRYQTELARCQLHRGTWNSLRRSGLVSIKQAAQLMREAEAVDLAREAGFTVRVTVKNNVRCTDASASTAVESARDAVELGQLPGTVAIVAVAGPSEADAIAPAARFGDQSESMVRIGDIAQAAEWQAPLLKLGGAVALLQSCVKLSQVHSHSAQRALEEALDQRQTARDIAASRAERMAVRLRETRVSGPLPTGWCRELRDGEAGAVVYVHVASGRRQKERPRALDMGARTQRMTSEVQALALHAAARQHLEAGNGVKAWQSLQQAMKLSPQNHEILLSLAQLQLMLPTR